MPPVLAHTVYQVVEFDQQLRSRGFKPRTWPTVLRPDEGIQEDGSEWEGLSETILGRQEWFDRWLDGERECTCARTPVGPAGSADATFASVPQSSTSATLTLSARRMPGTLCPKRTTTRERALAALVPRIRLCESKSLRISSRVSRSDCKPFEVNTAYTSRCPDRYRPLPLRHTPPFLLSLHLPLLQSYAARITSALDAFESLSFGLLPGALGQTTAATAGVGGAVRLVRAGVSARWMSEKCADWGEDAVRADLAFEAWPLIPDRIGSSSSHSTSTSHRHKHARIALTKICKTRWKICSTIAKGPSSTANERLSPISPNGAKS